MAGAAKASVHAEELRQLGSARTRLSKVGLSRSPTSDARYHIRTVDAGTGGSLGALVVGRPLELALGMCFSASFADVYAARKHDLRGFDELCPIYRVGKQLCKTEDACPCG